MAAWQEWLFWSLSVLLVLAGLPLLLWAIWLDRPRGRRRCPKCWYDMSYSTGLTCSECGRTPKHEKHLLRTRRHWRAAALALLLLLGAIPAGSAPRIRKHGWMSVVPTTALIFLVTQEDLADQSRFSLSGGPLSPPDILTIELLARTEDNSLWNWQWNLLIDRILGIDWPLSDILTKHQSRWPVGQPFRAHIYLHRDNVIETRAILPRTQIRILPRFDHTAEGGPIDEIHWPSNLLDGMDWTSARNFGTPRQASEELSFDIVIERVDESLESQTGPGSGRPSWRALRKQTLSLPVRVAGSIDEFIRFDSNPELTEMLRQRAHVSVSSSAISIKLEGKTPDLKAIPAVVELFRNGQMVFAWMGWLSGTSPWSATIPSALATISRPFGTSDYPKDDWFVRIVGAPERALLEPHGLHSWEGEFTIPLHILQTHERLFLVPDRVAKVEADE